LTKFAGYDKMKIEALKKLQRDTEKGENLMPGIVEAARAYATLGEICGVLRRTYGEYKELIVI